MVQKVPTSADRAVLVDAKRQELFALVDELSLLKFEALRDAFRELLTWCPGGDGPDLAAIGGDFYTPGDEQAPFFTESYLYSLLGKSAARSLLVRISAIAHLLNTDDE